MKWRENVKYVVMLVMVALLILLIRTREPLLITVSVIAGVYILLHIIKKEDLRLDISRDILEMTILILFIIFAVGKELYWGVAAIVLYLLFRLFQFIKQYKPYISIVEE